ncbi:MAG TPA: glycosyltransferase family 39 protein [Candidatus Dormibacteraeota bacterium]|jgi:4-amino-4-deoxy-L-arabinose transferase-like glycosyltransferase|nr:glycosyltransferase family 39 protein [Candidatus Dormibacteraeota bacterium]
MAVRTNLRAVRATISGVLGRVRGMRLRRPGGPAGAPATAMSIAARANLIASPAVVRVVFGAALAAGALLRTIGLMHDGLNSDEAVYSGQAAALAGDELSGRLFGAFRAHPLFGQLTLSVVYRVTGLGDTPPRVVAVITGLLLACVIAALAYTLLGRAGGALAFVIVCLSPYCLVISRQFLLDGPMALLGAISLLLMVLYLRRRSTRFLYAAVITAGLALVTKEPALLLVPAIITTAFVARRTTRVTWREALICVALYVVAVAPLPLSVIVAGGSQTTHQFLVWQLFRPANHTAAFYLTTVAPAIGLPVVLLAALGLVVAIRRHRPEDVAVVSFLLYPLAFFELWPVKGYEYLLILMPSITVLSVQGLLVLGEVVATVPSRLAKRAERHAERHWTSASRAALATMVVTVLALGAPSVIRHQSIAIAATDSGDDAPVSAPSNYLAGTGGLQGAREVGAWMVANTPDDTVVLTIGPTFANVVQFYGRRHALALSVSPNPLHRNPTYQFVDNPDKLIRTNQVRYLVWDAYSASRSSFFSKHLLDLVKKFHGAVAYEQDVNVERTSGHVTSEKLVVVYAVYP